MPNLTRDCCCLCIAGYPGRFAAKVGLSTFRHNEARAGGQGIDPGSDDGSLSDSVIGDEDSEEDDNNSLGGHPNAHDSSPNATNNSHSNANDSNSNADSESLIGEATEELFRTSITNANDDMRTHSVRCEYVRIRSATDTDVNHIHMLITDLPPGTELSSLHYTVDKNKRDYTVTLKQAPEMHVGRDRVPLQALFDANPTIAASLTLGFQDYLNTNIATDEDPHQPRPVLTASGRFSAPVEPKQLDPLELYLMVPNRDMFMTHQVPCADEDGTVPAFVAIGFFLEEQTPDSRTSRRQKFDRKLPAKPSPNVSTNPNSPSKRPRPSTPSFHTPKNTPSP